MNLNPVPVLAEPKAKDAMRERQPDSGEARKSTVESRYATSKFITDFCGGIQTLQKGGDAPCPEKTTKPAQGNAAPNVQAAGAAIILFLYGCCNGYDCGLTANIQTRREYALFLREHPHYNQYRNWPYMFDPEKGGWYLP